LKSPPRRDGREGTGIKTQHEQKKPSCRGTGLISLGQADTCLQGDVRRGTKKKKKNTKKDVWKRRILSLRKLEGVGRREQKVDGIKMGTY